MLSEDEVRRIAHLARLAIPEAEIEKYRQQLSSILQFDDQFKNNGTKGVAPMAHPFDNLPQPLRPDVVTETNQRDSYLVLAPEKEEGLFLVPKVIE